MDSYIGSFCFANNLLEFQSNCLWYDYIIEQNKDIIKTSKYYYIDYQYILTDEV